MIEGASYYKKPGSFSMMKGHMPIALDDIFRSDKEIPYLKPSDKSSFVEGLGTGWILILIN